MAKAPMASRKPPVPKRGHREDDESAEPGPLVKESTQAPTSRGKPTREEKQEAVLKILEGLRVLQISSPEELQSIFDASPGRPQTTLPKHEKVVCVYDLETTGLGKTDVRPLSFSVFKFYIVLIMSVLNRALASLKWVPLQSFIRNRAPGPRSTRFMGYGMCAIFGVLFRSKAYFLPTSTPEKEVSPGVPHAHTAKSLRAMGTKPFSKDVGPRFRAFLDKHGVTILAAHNGKRYDHRIMAFHGFQPQRGVLAADTMVS